MQRTYDQEQTKKLEELLKNGFSLCRIMEYIDLGADPGFRDSNGNSLHHFIIYELTRATESSAYCFTCMEVLVQKYNIDINIKNDDGLTPLAYLISFKSTKEKFLFSLKMVEILNADSNIKNRNGTSFIFYIINNNREEHSNLQELIKNEKINPFMDTHIKPMEFKSLKQNFTIAETTNATVYNCTWNNTKAAFKKTHIGSPKDFNSKLRRFINEVTLMEKLAQDDVPNVIKFIGCEIEKNSVLSFNILMELAECTLADLFQNEQPYCWCIRLKMMSEMANAVSYLHDVYGFVHADIKPQNIFIGKNKQIKLGDYNLSFKNGTKKGSRGTNFYMAPETEQGCTYATDIYSLAMTLFDFAMWTITKSEKRPLIAKDCPTGAAKLITLGMLTEPEKRPPASKYKIDLEIEAKNYSEIKHL